MNLIDRFPDPKIFLELQREDLAILMLEFFLKQSNKFCYVSQIADALDNDRNSPYRPYRKQLDLKIAESFHWLVCEGFLIPDPGQTHLFYILSERSRIVDLSGSIPPYRISNLIPWDAIHPKIKHVAMPMYLRGAFGPAVFESFREIEVALRSAPEAKEYYGSISARKALGQNSIIGQNYQFGNPGERDGLSDLFAGAIATFKNPHSHRRENVTAEDAAEMIMFASQLMKIWDGLAIIL